MRRRVFGRTGLLVSELALGTVELGLDYGLPTAGGAARKPGRAEAATLLNRALDLGINLIDTARAYGDAEAIIGESIAHRRAEYFLLSKVQSLKDPVRAVEESLRLLRTDVLDFLLLHCGAEELPGESSAAALLPLKQAGKVRFLGASVYGPEAARTASAASWCDCIEVAYSPLDRRLEKEPRDAAGPAVLARSVLLKGALSRRIDALPAPAFTPLKQAVGALAESAGVPLEALPEIAYRYVLSSVPPHSVLIGTADLTELEAAARYAESGPLEAELLAQIRRLPAIDPRWMNPGNWPPL